MMDNGYVYSMRHQRMARPIHIGILILAAIIALGSIAGGIYAVFAKAVSESEIDIIGSHLKTSSVGIGFMFVGVIASIMIVRAVLRNMRQLAALPPDKDTLLDED